MRLATARRRRGVVTATAMFTILDFVGVAHNLILREIARQIKAGVISYPTICDSLVQWLARPASLREIADRFTSNAREQMQSGVEHLTMCSHASQSLPPVGLVAFIHRRSAYDDYLPDVEDAIAEASDADDLASSLSPIYDATSTMDSTDAAQVQGLVSVAQSSFEEWFDGSEVVSEGTSLASTLDGCAAGTMQGYSTDQDANGVIWYCDNQKWYATAYHPPTRGRQRLQMTNVARPHGAFGRPIQRVKFASFFPISFAMRRVCTISQDQTRDIVDGDAEGFSGGMFGGFWAGVAAAGGVSGYRAWKYDIMWAICAVK